MFICARDDSEVCCRCVRSRWWRSLCRRRASRRQRSPASSEPIWSSATPMSPLSDPICFRPAALRRAGDKSLVPLTQLGVGRSNHRSQQLNPRYGIRVYVRSNTAYYISDFALIYQVRTTRRPSCIRPLQDKALHGNDAFFIDSTHGTYIHT